MTSHDGYRSPLETRYASPQMRAVWSGQRKFATWRRLWLALAESQQQLGLDVTDEQLAELRAHLDDIDFEAAALHEAKLRHDVMAHIHALGDVAPRARPIIHLGATSQFVNCNTELLLIRDSLGLIAGKLARVIDALGTFAVEYRDLPTLAFTHYQPAQPTTVGKRATLWTQDFALALEDVTHRRETLRFRGVKGTTGTQASFMALFDGDERKVEDLDRLVTEKMGWPADLRFPVTGQTYPRLVDAQIVNALAVAAAAAHKCATDIRLLSNRKEIEEPFGKHQVGSSAMAYKRNPMRCERICGMARFVISLAQNPLNTAAVQWFERTLDDSSNRRLVLPEAFLALDGVLEIMHNVAGGLVVYEKTIRANLMAELPFMATENILMAAVQQGADRQEAHELIRQHSQAAAHAVKAEGKANDLLERLRGEPMFAEIDLDAVLNPMAYVGRAPEQVDRFLADIVDPIRREYADALGEAGELSV
ncbi:MAG: adenylosuccinate lyase [Planctomycetota bacterium]|nr:adenylosuccinate lyase [Planctomycetota bacterium]